MQAYLLQNINGELEKEIAKCGGRGKITTLDMLACYIWLVQHAPMLRSPASIIFC